MKKVNNEYHPNGTLAYTETRVVVAEIKQETNLCAIRTAPDGTMSMRVGRHAKMFDNGQLAWEINYDDNGHAILPYSKAYRKDGTVIEL